MCLCVLCLCVSVFVGLYLCVCVRLSVSVSVSVSMCVVRNIIIQPIKFLRRNWGCKNQAMFGHISNPVTIIMFYCLG